MLKSRSPLRVPLDQFTRSLPNGTDRALRGGQIVLALPGLVIGILAGVLGTDLGSISTPILTTTSILTGFTFSMAIVFWNKSIDARRDPKWAIRNEALDLIDKTRTHLIFTVSIGVINALMLLIAAILRATPSPEWLPAGVILVASSWTAGLATGLSVYLICLVAHGLRLFSEAFFILRQ